jgi:phage shock protein A
MDESRSVLVDFMAAEHRLRRQAVREAQAVDLWTRRAAFALDKDHEDLAREAQTRAERHRRTEQMLLTRAEEIRAEIEEMRAGLRSPAGIGRAPPLVGDDLDARLRRLEIEHELDAIRAAVSARRSPVVNSSESEARAQETENA